jgi:regulator of nonsense transcripts 1
MLVLDEAAQTTEPALICALAAAKAEQVVMVGDTRQLPPTITLMDLRDTLGVSPMARLEKAGVGLFTLQTQYRMPPSLLEHPSKYFYKGVVGCAEQIKEYPPPRGFPWPSSLPLAFINIGEGGAEVAHNFGGRSNPSEVTLIAELVSKVLDANEIDASGIAIISPYAKQVQRIRMELASRRGYHPKAHLVRVGTVDSFQGQETDLVLISTVRSNPLQELGFLRDPRRLCVAITRARRGLIIVGDRSVLQSCRHWAALLQSCDDRQCSMDAVELEHTKDSHQEQCNMPAIPTKGFDSVNLFDDLDEFYGLFSPPTEERQSGR